MGIAEIVLCDMTAGEDVNAANANAFNDAERVWYLPTNKQTLIR